MRQFLLLALLGLLVSPPVLGSQEAGWRRFRHPSYGFSISYPHGWEVLSGEGKAAFVAIGPHVAGVEGARLGLVVVTARIPSNATVDGAARELQRELERNAGTMTVLRTDRFTHRGVPALMTYVVRTTPQGIEQYAILMILAYAGRGYAILGSTATRSTRLAEETSLLQRAMLTFQLR
ncbi:MAG: hypothetical protein QN178_14550 [Armatimonadota bacterium]|nr:hypothetical protein [Armatimonadota bacterium]